MSFLTPMTAVIAAAVTVPLLLLLYFLKLRRRYVRIASTLLWSKSYEDLEVNTPFQRLRFSALLVLQMLVLAALLMAMARPVTQGQADAAGRLILVIDRSASMNAADAGPDGLTRLEAAKAEAAETVQRLGRGGGPSQVMIIAFARTAHVVRSFDFDRSMLLQAIDSIQPTDEPADLNASLQLAAAFAGDSEEIGAQAADVVLFSDGSMAPPEDVVGYRLRSGTFRFVQVGPERDSVVNNIGIASFSARRDYDDPTRVLAFARLVNAGTQPIDTVLTLRVNGEPADLKRTTVPAAGTDTAGEVAVTFSIELHREAVLSLRHNHSDVLPYDDTAWLVMPPPTQPRIALVHPGRGADPFTHDLVSNLEPRDLRVLSIEAFDELDTRLVDAGEQFDLVVFDRVSPRRLPGVPSLTFGGVPRGISAIEPRSEGGRAVLSWDRQHPIMRHVALDTIVYAGFGGYELPPAATALATGPEGPIIAELRTRGARHVLVGFQLHRSNWPVHVSIAVFMQNVLDYVTLTGSGQVGLVHQPGDAINVRTLAGAHQLAISGPVEMTVDVEPGSVRTLPLLRRTGVYEVQGAASPMQRVAVSMLSDVESDIRTRGELLVNAEATTADRDTRVVPRELWPYLAMLALGLLVIEWLAYCRRAAA